MAEIVDYKNTLKKYFSAVKSGDELMIDKEKYNLLWEVSSLVELIPNYIFLDSIGISFDFGSSTIKKGTRLFRIRDYNTDTDYSSEKEWQPSPYKTQGRVNAQGEEALYLGSTEMVCALETHQRYSNQYVLGEYECTEDIMIGGFLSYDKNNNLHNIASTVLNAFLIAPSRCDKNKNLFEYLETTLGSIQIDDLCSISDNVLNAEEERILPYKFAVLNQREQLHNLTNKICSIIKKQYPEGIRYSSCFFPAETPGILCSDYNLALYPEGIKKLNFLGFSIKTIDYNNLDKFNEVNIAKAYLGDL